MSFVITEVQLAEMARLKLQASLHQAALKNIEGDLAQLFGHDRDEADIEAYVLRSLVDPDETVEDVASRVVLLRADKEVASHE